MRKRVRGGRFRHSTYAGVRGYACGGGAEPSMPPRNKCFCRAFSIDRRGGYYENFFCRDLGEFAPLRLDLAGTSAARERLADV